MVLRGGKAEGSDAAPTGAAMPSLGWRLSDEQIARVLTYIRNSWGNAAPAVAAADVKKLRQ
jgi:mono/diheme cytochrome c family protein